MPRTNTYNGEGSGTPDPDALLSIGEAARFLGFHVQTLRNWEAAGKLIANRTPGGRRIYRYADLERTLAEIRGAA